MCTCVHISVTKWCVLGDLSDALCNLWDRFVVSISTALHWISRLWVNGEGYFSGYLFTQSTMWLWIRNISRCMLSNALANKYWFREHIFSCDQAALWMVQSVRLSVRPSVRPSRLFDYVPIIVSSWNFQELLPVTEVTSMQKVKVRGQRSRSQRSQPNLTVSGL